MGRPAEIAAETGLGPDFAVDAKTLRSVGPMHKRHQCWGETGTAGPGKYTLFGKGHAASGSSAKGLPARGGVGNIQ